MKKNDFGFTQKELSVFKRLNSPEKIQRFLDELTYSPDEWARSPRRVIKDRRAHCYDGALFAACALRMLGFPPLIIDMWADRDDDHVIALFKQNGHFGAVGKSNFVGLRFREPVYRTTRELVMSYFDCYYNVEGEKTLRAYSLPINLAKYDRLNWMVGDEHTLQTLSDKIDAQKHIFILNDKMKAALRKVDDRTYKSGMLGLNEKGLYRPKK
ncbi:MAG: hypothetical protein Kow0090_18020 [Myxococcota bacterium]